MSYREYLEDSSKWGNYQYVPLEQIINDYLANLDEDDYTANTHRHKVLFNALRGLRELYFDVLQEIKAIELDLSGTLSVVLPPDYVNYVRISWVDKQGMLHPMTANKQSNMAQAYLQDHEYNILFDAKGCVMTGSGTRPDTIDTINRDEQQLELKQYGFSPDYTPNLNLSKFHKNGSYRIDKANGIIQFDSTAKDKSIVLEYISDGLYTACGETEADISVHKFAEQAIIDFIYYHLIKQRKNVPANEKMRARKEYYNSRRIAGRRINTIRRDELVQAMSGSTMNIEPSN